MWRKCLRGRSRGHRVILRLVDEQLGTYDNQPGTVHDALRLLGEDEVVEVELLIGVYALLASVIKGLKKKFQD
ncbi:uncharacterized protein BDW43DRAFT_226123 [Aspergillus alliaceus]|uniref:uncharacterized protein n=1 Tax=Petromyces alliaceus TaxID=209559 RepID=UPI0012A411F0|nr:uncharacterized protein BDW43DRAFT_226123 [Aspergillus alliaceus]KAB8236830.1 hypothetical protein BDW43DRAFT_226123 [Aspergillus alliaceus]